MPAVIPTAVAIETALREQWGAFQGEQGHPPVRTSTLTLVVLATTNESAEAALAELAEIADHHPSRTVVLVLPPLSPVAPPSGEQSGVAHAETDFLTASATATMEGQTNGAPARLVYEVVRLAGHTPHAQELCSGLVLPLLLPDLPVYAWAADWTATQLLAAGRYDWLLDVADVLLVDSATAQPGAENASGLETIAGMLHARQGALSIADFAWLVLEPWRQLLAQFFDSIASRAVAAAVSDVEVTYESVAAPASDGARPTAAALLVGGWLHARLPRHPAIRFTASAAPAAETRPWLASVVMRAVLEGGEAHLEVERAEDRASANVRTTLPGAPPVTRLVRLQAAEESELLRRRLHAPLRDPAYEEALDVAITLGPARTS